MSDTGSVNMWDERYSMPGYAYGTDPNAYLAAAASQIPPGRVLSLGDGEGRNGVFLAQQGYEVTSVDGSAVGVRKARQLAADRGVAIEAIHAGLEAFEIEPKTWSGIVSIFCHLPPDLRARVNQQVVEGLVPGGVFILEAYTPRQLEYGTGGPPIEELLVPLQALSVELAGLELLVAQELEREVVEGRLHTGRAHVVHVVGRKPE